MLKSIRYLKILLYFCLFFFFYLFLPIQFTSHLKSPVYTLFIFYFVNIIILFYLFKTYSRKRNDLELKLEDLQEEINILSDQNKQGLKNNIGLQEKIKRYKSLKNIIEDINQNLLLEYIGDSLTSIAFSLIANNKGACILYLIDEQTQRPNIFKTKKEDKKLIIKSKEGDIFDFWTLRHASPLIIEDTKKDFRFDLERLQFEGERLIASLISAPLIAEQRFLGILRLDNVEPNFYSQDDLRFLVTICDIGAVALENGKLFQRVQELAIHDGLTMLYTKGYFLERLKEECKRSLRRNFKFSLLMIDIDYFKNYNDKYGHTAGDIVLKTLGFHIVDFFKGLNPIISRFGGEEFCVVLSNLDKKTVSDMADKLRKSIENIRINLRGEETSVTVSIGIASFPTDAGDENEIVYKADRAMYEAKQRGRNQVCFA